ncbi:hypothetical protein, partial [Paenibacillus polymyxa]|uniref:hypothetical protein n=1 Tax=Paenibacillus polymyxa TaxID=1406 RepID=UPI0006C415E1
MENMGAGVELELYSQRILTEKPNEGLIKMFDGTQRQISYHVLDGLVIVEGDIVLGPLEEVFPKGDVTTESIIIKPLNKWPNK